MDQFVNLVKGTRFSVREADNAIVGDFWKNIVFFYKHNRLYYVTKGEAELVLKDTTLRLQPHKIYYIPSYSVITANCNTFFYHHFIHFEFDGILKTFYPSMQLKMEADAQEGDEAMFQRMEHLLQDKQNKLDTSLEINGIMQVLLSRFLSEAEIRQDLLRYSEVITYIEKNIDKKITVKELADLLHLNEVYFSNSFTKSVGTTPSQFIIEKKLSRAMLLLRDGKISIKEIAYSLGFNNELYFSRLFKKKTGFTPSEFRRSVHPPKKN